jgi:hypothetical protein
MTGRMEKARKTNNRFPSLSHRALGNRCRDSHIPTAPVTVFPVLKTKNERSPWLPAFICSVQAHSSMRKCSADESLHLDPYGYIRLKRVRVFAAQPSLVNGNEDRADRERQI